jgi:hypothetical protein
MFTPPASNWSEAQWTKWGIAVARALRFNVFDWDAPNVPAASTVDTTLTAAAYPTVEGLRAGMPIVVTPPAALPAGLGVTAFVGTDDTLTVRLINVTAGAIDPGALTWSYFGSIL